MNGGAEAVDMAIKLARTWGYKVKGIELIQSEPNQTPPLTKDCEVCATSKGKRVISRRTRQKNVAMKTPFGHIATNWVYFPKAYNGNLYMIHTYDLCTRLHFV